jgi:DNA-binding IclR family transcriptional regulator
MSGNARESGTTVTSRALALLGAFDPEHRSLTLTELATRAGLPAPTAHRLVGELTAWGAVAREPGGRYVVGRRMWDLGLLAPQTAGLRTVAAPFLQDLFGATFATVHLAVRDGDRALYVDRLSGHASVPVVSDIGSRLPLHATGVGKVLLAHAPEQVQAAVLGDLVRVTPYTITQPGRLSAQLRRVRSDGYAQTSEEMSLGACSIAVPVRDAGGVAAALGIVVADLRERRRLVAALQVAAQGIGRSIGGLDSAE